MKVYYAHCMAIYNTIQEERDLYTISRFGWEVINPNSPEHKEHWEKLGMDYKDIIMKDAEAVVFRALPDGRIPAGVAKEIKHAIDMDIPIIELPSGFLSRIISVDETREYLSEIGQR